MLGDFLNRRKSEPFEPDDALLRAAKDHQVESIIYNQTKDPRLLSAYSKALSAYANRGRLLKNIEIGLRERNIEYYLVKGPVVAANYPVPALRTMGDCDFVVHSEDRAAVREVLEGLGLINKTDNDDHEWAYYKGEMEFEVHDALLYYDALNSKSEIKLMERHWDYVKDNVLDRNFHFIYLLIHLKKHFLYEGVGFRQFMDLAVEAAGGVLDWDSVRSLLEEAELTKFAGICLALCERWFGTVVPYKEELTEEFYSEATQKIMTNGVFGFNDESNDDNNALNRVRRNGRLRTFIHNIFPGYKDCRYVKCYSWVNGKPWLLPAVWVYRLIRVLRHKDVRDGGKAHLNQIAKTNLSERDAFLKDWGI